MSAVTPSKVIELSQPLPESPYFEQASQLTMSRFWPLSEQGIDSLRKPDIFGVASFDEYNVLNGIDLARTGQDESTTLLYLAAIPGPEVLEQESRNPDLPADRVEFGAIDQALMTQVTASARLRGSTVLKTVGLANERKWLLSQGFELTRPDASFMSKKLVAD